jgi:hypothetical protein
MLRCDILLPGRAWRWLNRRRVQHPPPQTFYPDRRTRMSEPNATERTDWLPLSEPSISSSPSWMSRCMATGS